MPPNPPTHTTNLTSQALNHKGALASQTHTALAGPPEGLDRVPDTSCQCLAAQDGGGEGSWSGAQHVLSNVSHFISTKHISCSQEFIKKRIKTTWDSTHQIMNVSRRFELLTCHKLTTASFDHQVLSLLTVSAWPNRSFSLFFILFFFCFLKLARFSLELV